VSRIGAARVARDTGPAAALRRAVGMLIHARPASLAAEPV